MGNGSPSSTAWAAEGSDSGCPHRGISGDHAVSQVGLQYSLSLAPPAIKPRSCSRLARSYWLQTSSAGNCLRVEQAGGAASALSRVFQVLFVVTSISKSHTYHETSN